MPVQLRRVAAALILSAVLVTARRQAGRAHARDRQPQRRLHDARRDGTSSDAASTSAQPYQDKAALIAGLKSGAASATTAHVTMDMKAAGQSITMEGDTKIDAANPAMQVTMDMGPQMKLEMLLVDNKAYMKGIPGIPDGKWAVVDSSSEVGKQMENSLARPTRRRCTTSLRKDVTGIKPLGEEAVDGDTMQPRVPA